MEEKKKSLIEFELTLLRKIKKLFTRLEIKKKEKRKEETQTPRFLCERSMGSIYLIFLFTLHRSRINNSTGRKAKGERSRIPQALDSFFVVGINVRCWMNALVKVQQPVEFQLASFVNVIQSVQDSDDFVCLIYIIYIYD